MSLKVTVLGSCGGYPRAGRACSGFLLQNEGRSLLLDIGSGALSNMFRLLPADGLDGLVISHMHYDHYVDAYGLYTARRFWGTHLPPLPVLVPDGGREILGSALRGDSRVEFFDHLHVTEAEEGISVDIAGFEVTPQQANHSIAAICVRVSAGGHTVCYTGDTDKTESVIEMARGADLFICEATFTGEVPNKIGGHLYASEAGRLAAEAGASALLLTHVWPTLDEGRAVEDARSEYQGTIQAAVEGLTLDF